MLLNKLYVRYTICTTQRMTLAHVKMQMQLDTLVFMCVIF